MGVVRDKSGSGGGVVPGEEVGAAGEWSLGRKWERQGSGPLGARVPLPCGGIRTLQNKLKVRVEGTKEGMGLA